MESLKKKPSRYSDILGPGFRFHPTDEELVQYYLRRKNCGKSFRFDAISDVDVYKTEPWDLPHMSKLKTRDLEWYFFSLLDKKYGNGARTNRATEKGYWKTTGKDRPVYHKMLSVGWKKTLVYHFGRAPSGSRTNWVMHEYRLADSYLEAAGIAQDAFVVCRIFQKSGTGPKNGEQYGAPLVEEEWDNDELVDSDVSEEVGLGDETILNSRDVQQIVGSDVPLNSAPLPVTLQYADGSYVQETTTASFSGTDMLLVSGANHCDPKLHDDGKNTCYMPASCDADAIPVVQENLGECSKSGNSDNLDFLLDDGPLFELLDDLPNGDVGFVEANDLSNPTETDTVTSDMLDEYLACFDDNDYSSLYLTDPALMFGIEDFASDQTLLPQKEVGEASEQALLQSGPLIGSNISDGLLSSDKPEIHQSDLQYGYVQQASKMLGSIPAPPAFAAEFPSKDAVLRLDSVLQSPSPVHVSASTIHIRGRHHDKHQNLNVVLSFGFSRGDDGSSSLESSVSIVPGKAVSSISRGLVYFIFFGVLLLSMSLNWDFLTCKLNV